jgi:hypothetical protein
VPSGKYLTDVSEECHASIVQVFWDCWTKKLEVTRSCKPSISLYQLTRCDIPEDLNLECFASLPLQTDCIALTFLKQ